MADIIPQFDAPIPQILDPILDYLSSTLPSPLFNTLVTLVSHAMALLTSVLAILVTLFSSSPSTWDAQTIIPPLITLLAAYLALVSFYRTTWWMIRTGFWFFKWGTILAAVAAGAGWVIGNANTNGGNGIGGAIAGGLVPAIGAVLLDMLNGRSRDAADSGRSTPRWAQSQSTRYGSRPQSQKPKTPRPKAWESWDRHREWQDNENGGNGAGSEGDVKKVVGDILGAAGRVVSDERWWAAAKGAVDEFSQVLGGSGGDEEEDRQQTDTTERTNAKTKAKTTGAGSR